MYSATLLVSILASAHGFASMRELGCAGHGLESSGLESKCGTGNGDWSCESLATPNAPDCRKCTDPFDDHEAHLNCPLTRVVTKPLECCKVGGTLMLDVLHTLVTGFNSSVNGFAYGIKYTLSTVGGPFDGQPACLINREVLNDHILFPNTPNLPWYLSGGLGALVFQDSINDKPEVVWNDYYNDSFKTCDWEGDRENCLANSPFAFIKPLLILDGRPEDYNQTAEMFDKLAGTPPNSMSVQDCTDADPLDWRSITEATYRMGRNPDTACAFGQFVIQDFAGEQPAECEGINPVGKSAEATIRDAEDLLAEFHADKSSGV